MFSTLLDRGNYMFSSKDFFVYHQLIYSLFETAFFREQILSPVFKSILLMQLEFKWLPATTLYTCTRDHSLTMLLIDWPELPPVNRDVILRHLAPGQNLYDQPLCHAIGG